MIHNKHLNGIENFDFYTFSPKYNKFFLKKNAKGVPICDI